MRRYPGLSPFSADQKDIFFGREKEIRELSKLIFVERKVLLYSKSGYGKTSLLNAGVIPALKKYDNLEFIKIRFYAHTKGGETPARIFLNTISQHPEISRSMAAGSALDNLFSGHEDDFWVWFKKNQLLGDPQKTYTLVFDQFEELFTYPEDQVSEFKARLSEIILTDRLPPFFKDIEDKIFSADPAIGDEKLEMFYKPVNIKAVFSMRSDRLSELNYLTPEISDIQKVFYELKLLGIDQAREALLSPSGHAGEYESKPFRFDEAAEKKILQALSAGKDKIELTQLQILCHRIEDIVIAKDQHDLTIGSSDIPNFKDVFLEFYISVLSKIRQSEREAVRRFVEDQLIVDQTRIALDETVCKKFVGEGTLRHLVDARLLRSEKNSVDKNSYELSHDSLIEPINAASQIRKAREKEIKRRRRVLIAFAISAVLILFSLSLVYVFYSLYNKAVEKDRQFRQSQYEKQLNLGDLEKEKLAFDLAIAAYGRAAEFDSLRREHVERIAECKASKEQYLLYEEYIGKADSLYALGDYFSSSDFYLRADSINRFNPDYTRQKILQIAGSLKESAMRSVTMNKTDRFTIDYLKQARKLNPDDKEIEELLKRID